MVEGLEMVLQRLTTAKFIVEEAALLGQPHKMLVFNLVIQLIYFLPKAFLIAASTRGSIILYPARFG
jgi:hypothetical protein